MKNKISLLLVMVFIAGLIATSCKSSSKCPAYGEKKRYQVEKAY